MDFLGRGDAETDRDFCYKGGGDERLVLMGMIDTYRCV